MKKQILALLLCGLLMLSLAACGGESKNPAGEAENPVTQGEGGASENGAKPGMEVKGLALKEYTNIDYGFTLLAPDMWSDEGLYSTRWVLQVDDLMKNENYDKLILFAYTAYHDGTSMFAEEAAKLSDPQEIPGQFMDVIRDIYGTKTGDYASHEITGIQWKEMSVSGIPAAEFKGSIDCDKAGILGITGICIAGEKRPYMFWAVDLSADQSYLDMAQEVLDACVANFKEGS